MKISKFKKGEKICIFRSAFLGDWITILPFINYLIEYCEVKAEDIFFIIMNKGGSNPAALILGRDSIYSKNTYTVDNSSKIDLLKSAKRVKNLIPSFNKLVLLSFTHDNFISIFKKRILSYYLFGLKVERFGFNLQAKKVTSESQYISYFDKLDITYIPNDINLNNFLEPKTYTKIKKVESEKMIAIYPNSKLEMKIWPLRNYIEVINCLNLDFSITFYLIGGEDDYDYNESLVGLLDKKLINIKNIAGQKSIKETIYFLNNIDLLIANDGAPIHFAALVNTPTVSIFTYKEPVGAWEPLINRNYITIRTEVSCKMCYKEYCSNNICIKSVKTSDVINASLELLNKRNNNSCARIFIPEYTLSYKTKYGS